MDDHNVFAEKSELYAQARPGYPQALFEYLNSVCSDHDHAWDAACGSGQAALRLATYFNQVQATDISERQIAHAVQHPKVRYTAGAAEATHFNQNQF